MATTKAKLYVSDSVRDKLSEKHRVTIGEILQCFENREGVFLEDTREDNRTDPPTQWFIAETNRFRKLKVVFILEPTLEGKRINIRTAYEPNPYEIDIYDKHAK